MRRPWLSLAVATTALLITAAPTLACGGLIGPNGAVNLLRTTTFAGYTDGVEHYVTSFEFAGGGGSFGSITPLPGIPTDVVRGGDWTLQRLIRETDPVEESAFRALATADAAGEAEVLLETTIDALDITILRGGGDEVGLWAKNHGFRLPPDAPEVLDFYADRSPIFMAAAFDADAAAERGQAIGDGTPVHLTIPTDNPWVPLRILGLGKAAAETVEADVYLLTDAKPALLPNAGAFAESDGLLLDHSAAASDLLLADLRSDVGMEWVPDEAWLTKVVIDTAAGDLDFDLAIDASGAGKPSAIDAGYAPFTSNPAPGAPVGLYFLFAAMTLVAVPVAVERVGSGRPGGRPPAAA
ncbi:MAG: DUF2330 domain-containing protein [Chloroflexi bacterium]|nr:DUF2330 domain-containing protein [Chloroflexota bacterium]MBA3739829.1 DUF2330 domain-containing protein [Chloroflexota bacterium]